MRKIEVCFTPALLPLFDISDSIVVVIDIFRATSSITYGIDNGAEEIIPVSDIEECRVYNNGDYLKAAEREGVVVDGFDFGNSPFSYTTEKVKGQKIVLTTTNGTHAIKQSLAAHKIVAGSFLNISALCNWLHQQEKHVLLLCAGWKNKFNLEDTLFAGAVVNKLRAEICNVDDAGLAAEDLFLMAQDDLRGFLRKSSHTIRLQKLNIEKDIQFCLQQDICHSIAVLKEGKLVRLDD